MYTLFSKQSSNDATENQCGLNYDYTAFVNDQEDLGVGTRTQFNLISSYLSIGKIPIHHFLLYFHRQVEWLTKDGLYFSEKSVNKT